MESLTPPSVPPGREEEDLLRPPPPVRRILVEQQPTIVQPPPGGAVVNGNGAAPTVGITHSPVRRAEPSTASKVERMRAEAVSIAYGDKLAVNEVTIPVRQGEVLALIGPSGCGKTTLLRSFNRLVEITPTAVRGGRITLDGKDIDAMEVTDLRRLVSMVFQQPNPFPMSVFDNVAYALREQG